MKTQTLTSWQPVSKETRDQLYILQMSADPADRLRNDYYPLQQRLIVDDYLTMVKNANEAEDWDLIRDAKEALAGMMAILRQDYLTDLRSLYTLQSVMADVWDPFGFEITPPVE